MYIKLNKSSGFTLIELMVGLVVGLIATIAIMQTFSLFEGQKRTTTGTSDAQVNGSIAMHSIQQAVQSAGFGLPMFDATSAKNSSPLLCNNSAIDHDTDVATPSIDLFPIAITDGGASADLITVSSFPGATAAVPVNVQSISGSVFTVDNNLGCRNDDLALVIRGTSCRVGRVTTTDANLATNTTIINLQSADVTAGLITTGPSAADFARLTCLGPNGSMNLRTFRINNNQLEVNGSPIIDDIVDMQAQYGVAANANSNQITAWVDATGGTWAAPTNANRNRIRAIRVAILARNGLIEKTNVTTALPPTTITLNAPGTDWQRYRYRAYETIIPIRNLTWNNDWL